MIGRAANGLKSGVAVVAIRMVLLGGLAIGALDHLDGGRALDAQNFVIATLFHRIRQPP